MMGTDDRNTGNEADPIPSTRRAGTLARVLCGALGALGVAIILYDLVLDLGSELTWTHAVRYLVLSFACYIFLFVAVRGEMPSWLDI